MTNFITTSLLCACPASAALGDIDKSTCFEDFGQVVGGAFQRVFKADGSKNSFDYSTANPNIEASWTPFLTATDSTKIVPIPQFSNVEFEAGEVRTFGSGNQVVGGVPIVLGRDSSSFTGSFYRTPQAIIKQLKAMECEVGPSGGRLGVYLFNEEGQILAISDNNSIGGNPGFAYPIPLRSFFVGDLAIGGFDGANTNNFSAGLAPNWSDNTIVINPASGFNPTTDL